MKSKKNRLFEIFEHVTGINPIEPLEQSQINNQWNESTISEFLDTIGQDEIRMLDDKSGISAGDFGRVKFNIVSEGALYLEFQTPEMAHMAFERLSSSIGNPYEFSSRFDMMPKTIMVQFTDNGVNEDLLYSHATDAAPAQDNYQIGSEQPK